MLSSNEIENNVENKYLKILEIASIRRNYEEYKLISEL